MMGSNGRAPGAPLTLTRPTKFRGDGPDRGDARQGSRGPGARARSLGPLFVWCLLCASTASAQDRWSDPRPGVRLLERSAAGNDVFVAVVDLTRNGVEVRATRPGERGATTSGFAADSGSAVAINGDFYSAGFAPVGLAVGDGVRWPGTRDTALEGFLAAGPEGRVSIEPPEVVTEPPADWMREVVSGRPMVVSGGRPVDPPNCAPHFCERHPRTAVGLDEEGETLYLLVVDGRSARSRGMTTREVGEVLAELGAHVALNLDGGGSSALWVGDAGGVVNRPSDGAERVVANHIGVVFSDAGVELTGFVREGDIYDEAAGIPGALVELSSGESVRADERGLYRLGGLAPGPVTVHASAPGYAAGERDLELVAGELNWGSIALRAAAADAGSEPPDAAPTPDAAPADEGMDASTTLDGSREIPVDAGVTPDVDPGRAGDLGAEPDAAAPDLERDALSPEPSADSAPAAIEPDGAAGCRVHAPSPARPSLWLPVLVGVARPRRRSRPFRPPHRQGQPRGPLPK